ncbi:hypothetical protein LSCM1_04164 [Leishmania martiniquensis]|uniref:Uncharacterized protein n=1 Tax=Leishmania martiniquensis TaxID=1580590 RepID=A0A836HGR5_9TRYP|nr:hypothetical protein LSCM1_04164 [Leishmania martiniquensis]
MGSRASQMPPSEGTDPAGAPASTAPVLCCSAVSDVASKRNEQAERTCLRRSTQHNSHRAGEANSLPCAPTTERAQQHRNKYLSHAREHHLTRHKAPKDRQSSRTLAAGQRPVRNDTLKASTTARTVAHQRVHRRSASHESTPLAHERRPQPRTRKQRPRQCWTDTPYTGKDDVSTRRASAGFLPLLTTSAPHPSHGYGDG